MASGFEESKTKGRLDPAGKRENHPGQKFGLVRHQTPGIDIQHKRAGFDLLVRKASARLQARHFAFLQSARACLWDDALTNQGQERELSRLCAQKFRPAGKANSVMFPAFSPPRPVFDACRKHGNVFWRRAAATAQHLRAHLRESGGFWQILRGPGEKWSFRFQALASRHLARQAQGEAQTSSSLSTTGCISSGQGCNWCRLHPRQGSAWFRQIFPGLSQ